MEIEPIYLTACQWSNRKSASHAIKSGLVNNDSVIYKVKCFPEIHKSKSKRSVTFLQVAVYVIKKVDKVVRRGCGFNIAKLPCINVFNNFGNLRKLSLGWR